MKGGGSVTRLTAKQERYVQGLVAGLSQRQAYIKAYPNARKWNDNSVDSRASNLLKTDKVLTRYNELMDEHKDKALWTREDSVNKLIWLIEKATVSIEEHDEGYTRQATANALLNAIQELNKLELLCPLDQRQAKKIDTELEPDLEQDDKLLKFAEKLDEVYGDE